MHTSLPRVCAHMRVHARSIISYGSEYWDPMSLQSLLMHHPRWPKLLSILTSGSKWPVATCDDNTWQAKNNELIEQGNHKSAITYLTELTSIIAKEVSQDFQLLIPIAAINSTPNAEVAPVGIAKQWQVPSVKFRLTHNQSFNASVGVSVNDRVNDS